ncbi:hypothetical protein HMPREF9996_02221 [Aggregatibacter actinomycetemcomitans Y4]|nr:hypothetical protein CF65_01389 [Aggregatibacter actinomycetemcomitans HK1651]EKX93656.1 hypothetical protein HMPREF9996_02221 [Aggregatibacter actinomycetemcomitans Y4]
MWKQGTNSDVTEGANYTLNQGVCNKSAVDFSDVFTSTRYCE